MKLLLAALGLLFMAATAAAEPEDRVVRVGSKTFGESYILAEIASQLLSAKGIALEKKLGLGGTLIAYEALRTGAIDLYPEYTGTLTRAVLHQPELTGAALQSTLQAEGLQLHTQLGFNNTYAIAMGSGLAAELGISRISDLAAHPRSGRGGDAGK